MNIALQLPENTYTRIGKIAPRNASDIAGSNWTLGCETLDRDFADYNEYKEYIVPLGIKTVRFQGGWAKTEKVPGVYDFAWLDAIIDDAFARGLNILLETDYGNPAYPGGGGFDLAGGIPDSEEALAAWDRWVEAMATRYRGRVRDWAMWNEPDINPKHTPEEIARFNVRTARIVKAIIPDARIAGLSLAKNDLGFFEKCLNAIVDAGALDLFTWFIYHGYAFNPDYSYNEVEKQKKLLARHSATARMRQGENGCPSQLATRFALSHHPWTELSQAKWDLRRMLGDLGHDVESAIFTICDFNHIGREMNHKGLLRANEAHKVLGPKLAYFAVQHLAAVFDNRWQRVENTAAAISEHDAAVYTYRDATTDAPLVVFWEKDETPGESLTLRHAQLTLFRAPLASPVWCDLITGDIYEIPASDIERVGDFTLLKNVPIYDSPCIVTERAALV